jgi:hypothetical protein
LFSPDAFVTLPQNTGTASKRPLGGLLARDVYFAIRASRISGKRRSQRLPIAIHLAEATSYPAKH